MVKYEDVKHETTEDYFNGNAFSIDAFKKKYAIDENETYVQALKRVCDYLASVEKTILLQKYWSERWFDEIYNDWWHPAGSIMQGAVEGRKISLANCTTISLGVLDVHREWDNLESIIKNAGYEVAKCAAYRQGLGMDFSRLRPRGTTVLNSANESTGAVHWMQYIDSIGYRVGQKGRVPAMLFSLNISHPDIEEFIECKSDYTKVQNANISVQITNDFYTAVEKDEDWECKFVIPAVKKGDKVYIDVHSADMDSLKDEDGYYYIATKSRKREGFGKTIKARKLLEMIAKGMVNYAEPGIQNIDIARKYSNSDAFYDEHDDYDSRILSTNACSEQYLSRDSLCFLASLNFGKFSTQEEQYKIELETYAPSINRFLDNAIECELVYKTYATPHQRLANKKLRRTGAGFTNVGEWFVKLGVEYGSPESATSLSQFQKWYNYNLYKSSIDLGKEKGSFELFDKEKLKKSKFFVNLMKDFPDLTFDTLRNVTCTSIAPTGTLSLMFRKLVMSYGFEGSWGLYYWKRTRISGKYEYYFNVPNVVMEMFEKARLPLSMKSNTIRDTWDGKFGKPIAKFIEDNKEKVGIKFQSATEVKPKAKLDLMASIMRYVDSSISTTFMLPEGSDWKDVYEFIIHAYEKEVKSIAAFPDRKMYGIVSGIAFKDLAYKLKDENIYIHPQNFSDEERKELNISEENITATTSSPKRPPILDADVYTVNVMGDKFVVCVGLLNGAPYEMFGGHMNNLAFKFSHKEGKIEKVKRGQYGLTIGDDIVVDDFSKQFTPTEQILFRMVSTSMRHGVPLKFIVEQLQKASEDMFSMSAAAARVLKKYIKEGEKITGLNCPNCKQETLAYNSEGCMACTNPSCNWEKCS